MSKTPLVVSERMSSQARPSVGPDAKFNTAGTVAIVALSILSLALGFDALAHHNYAGAELGLTVGGILAIFGSICAYRSREDLSKVARYVGREAFLNYCMSKEATEAPGHSETYAMNLDLHAAMQEMFNPEEA